MLNRIGDAIVDHLPSDAPGPQEIGFNIPARYNASEILFRNLEAGRTDKVAVYAVEGNTSYGELCVKAAKAGNALKSLGCQRRSESRPLGRSKGRPVRARWRPLAKRAFR